MRPVYGSVNGSACIDRVSTVLRWRVASAGAASRLLTCPDGGFGVRDGQAWDHMTAAASRQPACTSRQAAVTASDASSACRLPAIRPSAAPRALAIACA